MLLRKLVVFAITSGLAKKAWDRYMVHRRQKSATGVTPATTASRRAPVAATMPSSTSAGATSAARPVETASTTPYH